MLVRLFAVLARKETGAVDEGIPPGNHALKIEGFVAEGSKGEVGQIKCDGVLSRVSSPPNRRLGQDTEPFRLHLQSIKLVPSPVTVFPNRSQCVALISEL